MEVERQTGGGRRQTGEEVERRRGGEVERQTGEELERQTGGSRMTARWW